MIGKCQCPILADCPIPKWGCYCVVPITNRHRYVLTVVRKSQLENTLLWKGIKGSSSNY